jgi:hypothetical protein
MKHLVKSILFCTLFSFSSFANSIPETTNMSEELRDLAAPIESIFNETLASWKMHRVRVRTRLEFGIEIPLLAKLKIKPEVELYFDKN